ncbi:hypothetical protein Y032_0017g3248 [Ancylostoma ceylanicum]|uniref:Uncharacterized protein n=1 Tax=Ancylostoma ceylanicum TaxID=53326 RepID=A0A016V472_9BILA|nr:hypothetical protein Y032_0017g3248 [Ancylostoma ceylanicum]
MRQLKWSHYVYPGSRYSPRGVQHPASPATAVADVGDGGHRPQSMHIGLTVTSDGDAGDDVTLLEQLQNCSILHGMPPSCMVFYNSHERRKRGLDKAAMEICFAIVDNAVSTESILCVDLCWRLLAVCLEGLRFFLSNTMKLFHPDQISIDLRMDVERLGRYLVKKGFTFEEIAQFLPVSWISDTIRAMN